MNGCPGGAPEFDWHPEIFATDARTQTVFRKTSSGALDSFSTANSRFDDMIVMKKEEPRRAIDSAHRLMNACAKWKSPAEAAAAMQAVDQLEQEVMEQVNGK